jgi:hypothetical protein
MIVKRHDISRRAFALRRDFRFRPNPHDPPSSLPPRLYTKPGMPASIPLHHCKFIDYNPSSITAIAFPPLPLRSLSPSSAAAVNGQTTSSSSSDKDKAEMGWMAAGKGNGDVDLFMWVERGEGGQGWVYFKVSHSSFFPAPSACRVAERGLVIDAEHLTGLCDYISRRSTPPMAPRSSPSFSPSSSPSCPRLDGSPPYPTSVSSLREDPRTSSNGISTSAASLYVPLASSSNFKLSCLFSFAC